ncbi:MAG: polyprenol monophosphomannose synthase [Nitrospirae bacterium]|nr:polyprenol monophosphomannose synthase [Nitrospirota bacterium]
MKKTLVILPTYNEKDALPVVLIKILGQEVFDILIIDDGSSDGTAEIARHWMEEDKRVNLIERHSKLGLGTAYLTGFKWGLEKGYECFIEMDADLSHNALDLPRFYDEIENGAELVIGSRYLYGKVSVAGWNFKRLLLSKFGNFYASKLLAMNITDMTSGFRAFSKKALSAIPFDFIHSEGYAFQIEMAYYVRRAGLNVKEIPIIFQERSGGYSKMSKKIVREAVWLPWRLRLRELKEFIKKKLHLGSRAYSGNKE